MIAPNMDMLAGLGAVIGFSAPVPSDKDNYFAGMLASVMIKSEPSAHLPKLNILPETPNSPKQLSQATAITSRTVEPIAEHGTTPKIVIPDVAQEQDVPTIDARTMATLGTLLPAGETVPRQAVPEQPMSDPVIASLDAVRAFTDAPTIKIEVWPVVVDPEPPLVIIQQIWSEPAAPAPEKPRVDERSVKLAASRPFNPPIMIAASPIFEPVKPATRAGIDKPELSVTVPGDLRPATLIPTIDKPAVTLPDRAPTFAPLIGDAVRDLVNLAQDKNVRFNVRPEVLGPVAVIIERSEAGPTLRLGVETQAAVQAVRQAEPMMNDQRGQAPFVQVTVDLNAPDQRGRPSRAPTIPKRHDEGNSNPIEQRTTLAVTGRYA